MSRRYSVGPGRPLNLDRRVHTIQVVHNPVRVAGPWIGSRKVTSDEVFEAEGAAKLLVTADASEARVDVTYEDEIEAA